MTAAPASAAATYTFFVSGSAVGQTSPGVAKDYTLNITNLNTSAAISFDLSIVASPQGWTTQLSQTTFTVAASATRQVTLTVQPPSTALADAVGQYVNVTATPDDNTTSQTVSTTTRVTEVLGVSVTLIPNAGTSGDPGQNITWLGYVKNTGNSQQTYTININNTSFTSTNLTTNLITVSPGDTRVILVTINISATAPVGVLHSRISATSNANASVTDGLVFSATVNAKRAVGLSGLTPDDLHVSTESEASVVVRNILIENRGNVADSYTLLGTANASRHGDWVTFEVNNVALAAFAQRYLNVTVAVPASITATGDYTVEFRILSDNSTQVIAFLNLTVTVVAKHDLQLVYDSLFPSQSGVPGATVTFPIIASNPGAYNQQVDLTYVGSNSSWLQNQSMPVRFNLAPGASNTAYFTLTIPVAATPSSFSFQIQGTINWSNPYRNRSIDLTLQIAQVYDTLVTSSVAARSGLPGASVAFTVAVRNNGTGSDTFTVAATNTTQAGLVTVLPTSLSLAAGASANVTVTVAIALTPQPLAGVYYYTVTATSGGNASRTASVALALTVLQTYSLSATVSPASRIADPGAVATYTVSVVNNGNGPDTITLERAGNNDTWVSFPVNTATIAPGARMNFTVEATAPTWADPGTTVLSVKAVSGGDLNVSSTATFSLSLNTVRAFFLVSTPGNVPNAHRNQSYSVDVTLRNSGNLADTYSLTLEGNDVSWTSLPVTTVALGPNSNSTMTLSITVDGLPANGPHTFYINATSLGNTSMVAGTSFNVTVNDVFRPELTLSASSLTTVPGATVTVLATVRNNGTVSDTLQLLVTPPVGFNQAIVRNFTLAPGTSTTSSIALVMSYPYSGPHVVTVTLTSLTDAAALDTGSYTINMDVRRAVKFEEPWTLAAVGGPGEIRNYSVWINNTGNITDTYQLGFNMPAANWTVWFSEETIVIPAGQRRMVNVYVQAHTVAAGGAYGTLVSVSSTTAIPPNVRDTATFWFNISYLHTLTNASASPSLMPGGSASLTVVLTNDGTADDNYTLLPNGTAASWGAVTPSIIALAPGTWATVTVDITVPAGQHDGARTLVLEARSLRGNTVRSLPITITVGRLYGLSLVAPTTPVTVSPGQAAVFNLTVQNTGNGVDTYTFSATPGQYAEVFAGSSSADAGETLVVQLRYTPPLAATAGTQTVELFVAGGGNQLASAAVTVVIRQVYNVSARGVPADTFAAQGAPGSQVQLTFNMTNRGNGNDTLAWVLAGPAAAWASQTSGSVFLNAGLTALVSVLVDIPSDPLVAVAGPVALNVTVTSQSGGAGVTARVEGAVTIDAVSAFTASFMATGPLSSIEDNIDRSDRNQRDYLIYLFNTGNRDESLTLSRAQISGWSIILLVGGSPGSQLTIPAGGNATAVVRIASFPQADPGQTVSVTVRTADNAAPTVSLSIRIGFLEPDVEFVTGPLEVSDLNPAVGSTVSVVANVRNNGPGSATGVVVRLVVDGQETADTETVNLPANRTVQLTFSWTIGEAHAGKSHTLSVSILNGDQVQADEPVVVPAVDRNMFAKLSTDSEVQLLVGLFAVLALVLGVAVGRAGRKRAPAPTLAPAPAPAPSTPEAAMEGLAALEAEGAGAPAAAPEGPAPVEHKIVCPSCGTEQWIRGAEGECKNCGVIIEVSEEEEGGSPPAEGA